MSASSFFARWFPGTNARHDPHQALTSGGVSGDPHLPEQPETEANPGVEVEVLAAMLQQAVDTLAQMQLRCGEIEAHAAQAAQRSSEQLERAMQGMQLWEQRATRRDAEIQDLADSLDAVLLMLVQQQASLDSLGTQERTNLQAEPPQSSAADALDFAAPKIADSSEDQPPSVPAPVLADSPELPAAAHTLNEWRARKQAMFTRARPIEPDDHALVERAA